MHLKYLLLLFSRVYGIFLCNFTIRPSWSLIGRNFIARRDSNENFILLSLNYSVCFVFEAWKWTFATFCSWPFSVTTTHRSCQFVWTFRERFNLLMSVFQCFQPFVTFLRLENNERNPVFIMVNFFKRFLEHDQARYAL